MPTASDGVLASVLMPVLDEELHIREAIEGFQAQRIEREIELLVIDGGSSDRTRDLVEAAAREDPRVRLLDNPRQITPVALNLGLAAARGEFVVRMDAHTHYPPQYVARGVERLRQGDVAWASGPQLPHPVGRVSRAVTVALQSSLGAGGAAFRRETEDEIDVDSGFTGVWRRETLEQVGGWDEGWPINQDAELAARITNAGGRIVCVPEMAARYVPRDSLRRLARQYRRYGFYRAKTVSRHREGFRVSHVLPPAVVATSAAALGAPGRPLRLLARGGLAAYVAALAREGLRARERTGCGRDALGVPVVLATMHLTWGAGFIAGAARFFPRLLRRR